MAPGKTMARHLGMVSCETCHLLCKPQPQGKQQQPHCPRCGSKYAAPIAAVEEWLTLKEIMARYKIGRTKAHELRREVRRRFPEAIRSHGRVVRVGADALERLWKQD